MSADAYSLYRSGTALLYGGNVHASIVPLENARDIEPQKASIREALARAYFRAGRARDSEREFAAALELEPTNHYAHLGLALCLERRGRTAEARGHARLAVAMDPGNRDYERILDRLERAT